MPKKICELCSEKQNEIDRILKGYRGDKRQFQKDKKRYQIIILSSFALNLLILAFGADGLKMALDIVKGIAE